MSPEQLRRCATVGTTSTTAVDPLPAIGPICRDLGVWLHVDAALAGTAALCPEFRFIHEGLSWADSYCFNPHKMSIGQTNTERRHVENGWRLICEAAAELPLAL